LARNAADNGNGAYETFTILFDSALSPRYGQIVVGGLRRALRVVAAIWLIVQMATLAITPAELSRSADACQCAQGTGAECPMHHPTRAGGETCAMRGAAPLNEVALTSLLGAAGCFLATPAVPADWSIATRVRPQAENVVSRFVPPDSPPPRA
jgi:hypothetical protein